MSIRAALSTTSLTFAFIASLFSAQVQSTDNNRTPTQPSSPTALIARGAPGGSGAPPNGGTPLTFFSMHVQSELFSGMPWPTVSFGSMRLWDTFTTWNDLNPSPGIFNWPALDRWLDTAQQHDVDLIYTFGATPTWASSHPTAKCDYNPGACYPPRDVQDWDNFVRAIATHAGGRIKYWEMWNEANQHEYWSGGIPALATMTQHASKIIKSISPSAKIFSPSGVGGGVKISTFLDEFFTTGAGTFVDGVAFHGYVNSIPARPESVNGIVDAVQSVMAAHGQRGKPLWDTEGSWGPSDHLGGDDARMAFVARHYILQWSKGVERFYWYAWNDKSYGTLFNSATATVEKAGVAYAQVESWLVGADLTAPCSAGRESTWTCNLTLAGGTRGQILWNAAVKLPETISFTPAPNFTHCTGLDGKITRLAGGTIRIGGKPVLLTAGPAPQPPAKKNLLPGMKEDEPNSSRSPFPPEDSLHTSPGLRVVCKELLGKSLSLPVDGCPRVVPVRPSR